jgi:hypothetical protein
LLQGVGVAEAEAFGAEDFFVEGDVVGDGAGGFFDARQGFGEGVGEGDAFGEGAFGGDAVDAGGVGGDEVALGRMMRLAAASSLPASSQRSQASWTMRGQLSRSAGGRPSGGGGRWFRCRRKTTAYRRGR